MTGNRKTEAALLEWVNTFPLDTEVESPSDLSDGFVLNQILRDFDPQYYVDNLEKNIGPSKWLSKKQSLERVYKSLLRYIRNHCDGLENITLENTVDFSAIAEHDDTEELVKLLTIMLMAAVTSNAEKYVLKIQDLKGAEEMMYIIQKMTELGKQSTGINATSWDDAELPSTLIKDAELAAEEERAALESQYSKLKKNYADHISRFERLQDNYDVLLQKHEVAETELQNLRESQRGDMGDYVRQLELEIRSKEDLIASQENKIEDDRRIIDNHKRSLKELGNASDQLLTLQDEVTELKIENGKLSKKANMVDNFQRKLESQASIEKENAKLRQQNETYEENMKEYDQTYSQNTKMKATIEEYRKKFSEYENEVVMLSGQKKSLQLTIEERDSRIERYMKQQEHDENFIAELQSQLQTGGIPSDFPQTPTAPSGGLLTLEQELDESRSNTNYALENSRLLAENQLLKDNTAGTTNATLRNELLEAEEKYKRLEQRFNQLTEDHAIGQEQLAAIISTSGDKHEAVINTRRLYLEASKERDSLKRKVAELTSDITSRDRDIVTAKGDLKALGEDELHSLEELKATHQLITSSYQNDLLMLQKQHKILTEENEQQKSHLVEALLAKDKLRQELANSRDGQPTEPTRTGSDAAAASKSKSELEALKEKTEKQQSALLELQRRLKAAEENSADGQKALMKNVLRENALMSTAWYDLSSRLQSNHVVLQRRQEAPKSWLNKQRQMVNATPRR